MSASNQSTVTCRVAGRRGPAVGMAVREALPCFDPVAHPPRRWAIATPSCSADHPGAENMQELTPGVCVCSPGQRVSWLVTLADRNPTSGSLSLLWIACVELNHSRLVLFRSLQSFYKRTSFYTMPESPPKRTLAGINLPGCSRAVTPWAESGNLEASVHDMVWRRPGGAPATPAVKRMHTPPHFPDKKTLDCTKSPTEWGPPIRAVPSPSRQAGIEHRSPAQTIRAGTISPWGGSPTPPIGENPTPFLSPLLTLACSSLSRCVCLSVF